MPFGQHLVYVSSRELLNALPANAALLSPDGEIKAVNTSWAEFAEQNGLCTSNYGVGANYFDICEDTQGPDRELSQEVACGLHELRRGLRTAFSIQYPCHSPTRRRWYLLNATRIGHRSPSLLLAMHEEITPLVLNQERLANINSELARVAMLISHDVRAPLHTIQSYVELIRRNVGNMLEQSTAEYFDIVSATTSRLSTFVTETINLALIGRERPVQMEQVDMDSVVREAVQSADHLIKEYNATIHIDRLGGTLGNFTFLVQLFQNLISNAITHSGQQARVHIGVTLRDRQKLYSVQDFGPGIPADFQESIFSPFTRPGMAGSKGAGVGLAICRYIVEHHGGHIFVESKPGQGSTFYFSLSSSFSDPPKVDEVTSTSKFA